MGAFSAKCPGYLSDALTRRDIWVLKMDGWVPSLDTVKCPSYLSNALTRRDMWVLKRGMAKCPSALDALSEYVGLKEGWVTSLDMGFFT